jgi:hypothetical protein
MACVFVVRCRENLQSTTRKKKISKYYMMMWHVNPHDINLGPHNIHVIFFKLQII